MLVRFFPVLYGPSMYEVFPLGMVESPLVDPVAAPKQGDEGAPEAWLVFEQHVADGLRDVVSGADKQPLRPRHGRNPCGLKVPAYEPVHHRHDLQLLATTRP